ncbi:unnamed protein product [Urochloa humidicola]
MAAAAGTALLRSMATKMGMAVAPRAPSLHRHPLFAPRGSRPGPTNSRHHSSSSSASSGSTPPPPPPPTNSKELTQNKNVLDELNSAKASLRKLAIMASFASFMMFGSGFLFLFSVRPRLNALSNEVRYLRRERSILIKAMEEAKEECERTHSRRCVG